MQPSTANTIIREMMTCRSISDMCDEITRQINSYIQKLRGEMLYMEYDTASNTNKVYYIPPFDGEPKKFSFKSSTVFLNWLIRTVESEERENKMQESSTIVNTDHINAKNTPDMVNHPPHYTSSKRGIECISAIYACVDGYKEHPAIAWLIGQIVKYLWRAPFKGNFSQDLRKAKFYMDEIIKEIESDDT